MSCQGNKHIQDKPHRVSHARPLCGKALKDAAGGESAVCGPREGRKGALGIGHEPGKEGSNPQSYQLLSGLPSFSGGKK